MRFVIQVVEEAQVRVVEEGPGGVPAQCGAGADPGGGQAPGRLAGRVGRGLLVLVGIGAEDTEAVADRMVDKMKKLRIFEDAAGKTNLDLAAVGGGLLLVSQFTLYANCKKGNRPSFVEAGAPEMAEPLFRYIVEKCRQGGTHVETGEFGAYMKVSLVNDGPFTIVLDSGQMGWH